VNIPSIIILAALYLATPLPSQSIGGGYQKLHQWFGQAESNRFGSAVSGAGDVNGDGYDDIISGAAQADPGGRINAGSAYVYSGADGALLYQWDGETDYDLFATSVAGAGDINGDGYADLMIGAPYADPSGQDSAGSVYLYSGADGRLLYRLDGWARNVWLGRAVSTAGDVNRDGFDDLLIGADGPCPGNVVSSGSVYLFSGLNGSLLYQWCGVAYQDNFGHSVADAGDCNGDGFADVIVGAFGAQPNGQSWAGSVFVYSGADGSLLHRWNGARDDFLGLSVSGAGDFNGDGFDDLLMGAYGADPAGIAEAGSAYVYSGIDGTLLHQWDGLAADDQFGRTVSAAGNLNGDKFDDVMVGMRSNAAAGLPLSGTVFVYLGDQGLELNHWQGEAVFDYFGDALSCAGDVNQDGFDDLLIGAYGVDSGGLNEVGSTYVYSYQPHLLGSTDSISALTGEVLGLELDFPAAAAGMKYKVLISATGIGPSLFGVEIPLTFDAMAFESYLGIYPIPAFNDLQGQLDSDGNAFADLTVPPGQAAALIGNTFYLAAVAHPTGQLPLYSSAVWPVTITP
jgi:FG-GAP repeat protein